MSYDKARVEHLLLQEKTESVISELIELNMGLIYMQLRRLFLLNDPDALSLGYEALYHAIVTYDSSKNYNFSTYAAVCIFNKLGSYIRGLKTQLATNTIYYETPVGTTGKRVADFIKSPSTADSRIMDETGVNFIMKAVADVYDSLQNPVHKKIIAVWRDSNFQLTQKEIAERSCCSQTYVSQILGEFKKKLKTALEVRSNA